MSTARTDAPSPARVPRRRAGAARRRVSRGATLLAAILLGGATPALAEDGILLRLAFEAGGDKLGQANFENGDSEAIKAGGEAHIELGLRRGLFGPGWESDLSVGYKVDTATARNGDITFSRITVNAMQYYLATDAIRAGAGLTYHLNPTFEIDVDDDVGGLVSGETDADDALGFMAAIEYVANVRVEIGLRATLIDYEFDNGEDADGNSFGAYLTYRFGD